MMKFISAQQLNCKNLYVTLRYVRISFHVFLATPSEFHGTSTFYEKKQAIKNMNKQFFKGSKTTAHWMAKVAFFAVCGLAMAACSDNNDDDNTILPTPDTEKECVRPDFLKTGDTIAIVSPSYVTSDEVIEKGMEAIRSWGFVPVKAPNLNKEYLVKYAGTIAQRASDLEWAYNNPEVKAIMCTRGGYGCIQLLDVMPADIYAKHAKWLVGYSDITTLHSASVRAGAMSIHGTMLSSLASTSGTADDDKMLAALLQGNIPHYDWQTTYDNKPGTARGVLVGGNLCTMAPIIGTEYDFTSRGDIILFIEEIGENARNIDRIIYSLMLHGTLSHVKGIITGDFYSNGDEFNIGNIEDMIRKYTLQDVNIPIAHGFHAGHAGVNYPLIEGAHVTLTAGEHQATLDFNM